MQELDEETKIQGNKIISSFMGVAYRPWHRDGKLLVEALNKYKKVNNITHSELKVELLIDAWERLVSELTVGNMRDLK